MSEDNQTPDSDDTTLSQSTVRNGIVLAIFALVSVMLTAATWVLTRDRIQTEKEAALLRAIDNLVPRDQFENDPYTDCIMITDQQWLGTAEPQRAWRLRDSSDRPVGVVLSSVAPNGYTGAIEFIAGYRVDGIEPELAGVRVTSHQETPGLGDKIDEKKSDWIYTLNSHEVNTIAEPKWQVKKDGGEFDGFTGATITPRALLRAVTNTTTYFRDNREMLFNKASNCAQAEDR